jgi:aminoglycoside 6'-N-acetyltransferase I
MDPAQFARYEHRRDERAENPSPARIRLATHADIDGCLILLSQIAGTDGWRHTLTRTVDDGTQRALFVAEIAGEIAGYGRAVHVDDTGSEGKAAPTGWYLLGLVVGLHWRRRGYGEALTRVRLQWISERADTCWCFVHADNPASIDLHRKLGFVAAARDRSLPGMPNADHRQILFRRDLS